MTPTATPWRRQKVLNMTYDFNFSTTRLPPGCDTRAEQSLLGAILTNSAAYERVADFLRPEHFYDPLHGKIYNAMQQLINAGRVADPITLHHFFANDPDFDSCGPHYIAGLLSAMVGIVNAGDYGRLIMDGWMRRQMIAAAADLHERCYAGDDDDGAMGVLEEFEARLSRVAEGAGDVAPVTEAGEAVRQALALTAAALEREDGLAGASTGYRALDRMTGGLLPGKVYLLAGRPSMGKTGIGLGIAARAAAAGLPALYWSGEMGPDQLGARMAAAWAGLNTTSVFNGRRFDPHPDADIGTMERLTPQEFDRLLAGEKAAKKLPLYFDTRAGITVAKLRARARRLKRTKKLGLLVIDYIGLMRASTHMEGRVKYEQVSEISKGLKLLAMELNIPIVVLSQLSRETEKREDKRPQMQDLRDSGSLEEDADVIMLLHRPHYYLTRMGEPVKRDKETADTFQARLEEWRTEVESTKGLARLMLAKNRQGPTGPTELRFVEETTWFYDKSDGEYASAWADIF